MRELSDIQPTEDALVERPLIAVLGFGLLPWLGVVCFGSGLWTAMHFLGYALLVSAIGYGAISVILPASSRSEVIILAPSFGVLAVSALGAFWLRLGLSILWIPIVYLLLFALGTWKLWTNRALWKTSTIAYGWTLVALSTLICFIFFLPSVRIDAVARKDGSFNWMYVDTQMFHGVAASIEAGQSPPRNPGTVTAPLFYHFGPYVPAAVISRATGLPLGDALARVTRGTSIWALVLSCFGIGTVLSMIATGRRFGGIATVVGFFFYGALLSLFTDEGVSASSVHGGILFTIPGINVVCDGGPFSHLMLGHSVLHGMGALTTILALVLVHRQRQVALAGRELVLLVLPALMVPINSFAALYCFGAVAILLFWGRLKIVRSWVLVSVMALFFLLAWELMGFTRAPDAGGVEINAHLSSQWWPLAVWLFIGLGFRLYALRWVSRPLLTPVPALVLATFAFLLSFAVFLQLKDGNERYGLYFLQATFSVFAFSQLTSDWWRFPRRSELMKEWLRLARNTAFVMAACGVFIVLLRIHPGTPFFRRKVIACCLMAVAMSVLLGLMKRNNRIAGLSSALVGVVLLIGFSAWITTFVDVGLERKKMDITLTAGEVQGLNRLRDLAPAGEIFATNKHAVDSIPFARERSYGYTSLSQRPALLEGYLCRGERYYPWFNTLLHDNDLMFTTTDPGTLHILAQTYHVRWLVTRPGTDIALPRPLPSWLAEQSGSGDLKIYRVD